MIYYRGIPIDELSPQERKEYEVVWIDNLINKNRYYLGAPHLSVPIKVSFIKKIRGLFK